MSVRFLTSPAASERLRIAQAWLEARTPGEEVLVVGATADAANELLRRAALSRGAAFGWQRATLPRLASALAQMAQGARAVPVSSLVAEALAARVLHSARGAGGLGRFVDVAEGPGVVRAVAGAIDELRLAQVEPARVADESLELARWLADFEALLAAEGLADRARLLALATACARSGAAHPWLGLPTLLLDVAIENAAERELVAALRARAPELLATLPAGDEACERRIARALGVEPERLAAPAEPASLARLQTHLFEESAPPEAPLGEDVALLSAPGESRECVEIARRIHGLAAQGTAFDRVAVLLRSPEAYRPHLLEAFGRAGIPAHFARGSRQPDPAGRAFLALLRCKGEGLSARGFAEYLSLGEVPDAQAGAPPAALPRAERFVTPDLEALPEAIAGALAEPSRPGVDDESRSAGAEAEGRVRAPRAWERLLVDAAVIGGRARWERRLEGLANELGEQLADLEDPDDPAAAQIRRDLADLAALRAFAAPLLDALDALPQRGPWGDWLDALSSLATRALRRPARVLSVLSELAPMAAVGPVDLDEVVLVLSRRLLELAEPPPTARYGRVFVAPIEAARGLDFDAVFVPGLAERLFPKKIEEEPILLDAARRRLDEDLVTRSERVAHERRALRLAVGAATRRVVLSYPRLDLDASRPRVPSFYTLEALRAAEGRLPGWAEMAARAEETGDARVGWPAPTRREQAIDEAEHDLALLERLQDVDEAKSVGAAHYLLDANPNLARALRFRARRWLPRWTGADGLVRPGDGAREVIAPGALEAMAEHTLAARSYSPTALQHFATCPYKFLLHAVHRLAPREEVDALEELDPLTRGALVHEVQFTLFGRLRDEGLLPVTPERFEAARARLDATLDEVVLRWRDRLAPAIPRVFEDAIDGVRADLRHWLRLAANDTTGYVPWRFELAFGLAGRRGRDPHSQAEPVALDAGIRLRGSIDLVERRDDGHVCVTDHKTGKDRASEGDVIRGGESLQPVLYALATEKLFPGARVDGGRLYYCTAAGNFSLRDVPLDAKARAAARAVAETIGRALDAPFLPAAPAKGACRWCDYQVVCGPYEELRTSRKPAEPLADLTALRDLE
ncbi:MAG TPA: PD-(D/E)XK nuclease family protein [Myxococcota bacterium]|nr:PD-(D/E)XK nuclease family protein [Myxococcota bacterium]